jgi:N4-gp56 family major capsid protein
MADTNYGVNHPQAQKLFSKALFHDIIGESYAGKFMGKSDGSLIQVKSETQKDAGDKITFGLRALLSGAGVTEGTTLEGAEEAMVNYPDSVLINQLRHAVRSAGEMSEQRVPWSVREEARMALKDWWIERMETCLANQLTGYTDQADTRYTGFNATTAPTSGRLIVGGSETAEGSLSATTTHAIKLADLDKAVAIAKTTSATRQRIRPVKIAGKDHYVCFLHPDQIYQLRRDASTQGNLWDVLRSQLQGGDIKDNPLITGAMFMYNNVIVHEWSYLPNTTGVTDDTGYRRGVFCGAQAAVVAFGQKGGVNKMSWNEKAFDYGDKLGVSAGMIFGAKKTVLNSVDFGTIVLSGYAPAQA